jgi:hypothetical protein
MAPKSRKSKRSKVRKSKVRKSSKLPKIYIDAKTGKRYVKVKGKKIWIGKDVSSKDVMAFLLKRRKKTRSKIEKVEPLQPRMFAENVFRSFSGIPNITVNVPQTKGNAKEEKKDVDYDEIMRRLGEKLPSMMPKGVTDKTVAVPERPGKQNNGKVKAFGKEMTGKQIEKGVNEIVRHSEKTINRIIELNGEIPKAKEKFIKEAKSALTARANKSKEKKLSNYLKRKATDYGIEEVQGKKGVRKVKDATIDELLPLVMNEMLDDDDEEVFPKVVEAETHMKVLVKELNKLSKGAPQPSPEVEEEVEEKQYSPPSQPEIVEMQNIAEVENFANLPNEPSFSSSSAQQHVVGDVDELVSDEERDISAWSEAQKLKRHSEILLKHTKQRIAEEKDFNRIARKIAAGEIVRGYEGWDYERLLADNAQQIEEIDAERDAAIASLELSGQGRKSKDLGLSTSEINKLMAGYSDYLGCIGSDQIGDLHIKPHSRFGFVMNTDPSTKSGEHWVSIYVDARPGGSHTIEFFNSFADQPNQTIMKALREVARKVGNNQLKLKVNKVADQDENSSNCGWFASKFLIDRFRGIPFAKATGHDSLGERDIEAWKAKEGLPRFKGIHLEQEGDGIKEMWRDAKNIVRKGVDLVKGGVQRVKDVLQGVRKDAPPNVRKWLEKNGNRDILEVKICRKPVYSIIEKIANLISQGKWEANKEKLSYDKLFHLYAVFTFMDNIEGDECWQIEKNQVVEMKRGSWDQDGETETVDLGITQYHTMNKLVEGALKTVGEKLWVYDARTQNCQYFMKWLFQYAGGWNDKVEKFVMQDVQGVLHGLGYLGDVARKVTDIAAIADVALQGAGRRRGYGGRR